MSHVFDPALIAAVFVYLELSKIHAISNEKMKRSVGFLISLVPVPND